jgi:hypothetical protein
MKPTDWRTPGITADLPRSLFEDLTPMERTQPVRRTDRDRWRELTYAYVLSLPVWQLRAHLSAEERAQAGLLARKARGTLRDALRVLSGYQPHHVNPSSRTLSKRRAGSRRSKRTSKQGSNT